MMFADTIPEIPAGTGSGMALIATTLLGCVIWAYRQAIAQNHELRASYDKLVEISLMDRRENTVSNNEVTAALEALTKELAENRRPRSRT
jgi:hypothetical protein